MKFPDIKRREWSVKQAAGSLSVLTAVCALLMIWVAVNPDANAQVTLTTLYSFSGSDGSNPWGELVQGLDGNFYGTTSANSDCCGTVFRISSTGTFTNLHSFSGSDGAHPIGALVQGSDGNFYGTVYEVVFGDGGVGTTTYPGAVFKITPSGSQTNLYMFGTGVDFDGFHPRAALVQGSDGIFYGTTSGGGNQYPGAGTVFRMTPAGAETVLYRFNYSDGAAPNALVQGSDGNFYGTTYGGGTNDNGTVFRITPAGTLTTLHLFSDSDGRWPTAGLVQGRDGNFYGTTSQGGPTDDSGTVFKITPTGDLTILHSFTAIANDGFYPNALVQGSDGNFYGTTRDTAFKITPTGDLTNLYIFSGAYSGHPYTGLVQGSDGNFYGTTFSGGTNFDGTVFRLDVDLPSPPKITTTSPLPSGDVGIHYNQTLTATNGTPPFSWSMVGGSLPTGLGLDISSGAITGTPTVAATTTAAIRATDSNSSTFDRNFDITINPLEPPTLTCPDINVNNAVGQCSASVPFFPDVTGIPVPTVVCNANSTVVTSPATFPVGTTTVSCAASNRAGTANCSFDVTVVDTEPPTLFCSGNITVNVAVGQTNAFVNTTPIATDNCTLTSVACVPPSGSSFPVGTTQVICTATDEANNSAVCTNNVTVKTGPYDLALIDMKAPKIVTFKAGASSSTKTVSVTIQNRSFHSETISNLTGLVTLVAKSLGSSCANAQVVLRNGSPNRPLPYVLGPHRGMRIYFDVTFNCANDPAKGVGHEDFNFSAIVNHAAIDGNADTHAADDTCPRAPLPDGSDRVDGSKDTGCGGRLGGGAYGGAVIADVVIPAPK